MAGKSGRCNCNWWLFSHVSVAGECSRTQRNGVESNCKRQGARKAGQRYLTSCLLVIGEPLSSRGRHLPERRNHANIGIRADVTKANLRETPELLRLAISCLLCGKLLVPLCLTVFLCFSSSLDCARVFFPAFHLLGCVPCSFFSSSILVCLATSPFLQVCLFLPACCCCCCCFRSSPKLIVVCHFSGTTMEQIVACKNRIWAEGTTKQHSS